MQSQLFKNFSWLSVDRVLRSVGGLTVGILVARYLGPDQFGLLSFAVAFVYFFSFLSDLGLHQIVIRHLSSTPERVSEILGTAFLLKLTGAVIAAVGASTFILLFGTNGTGAWPLVLVLAGAFLFQSLDVIDYYYQSQILSRHVVIARNLAFLISGAFKIYLIVNSYDVVWFAVAGTLELALAAIFLVRIFGKKGGNISQWRFDRSLAIDLLRTSWPLALSTLLISIHMRIDQIMIGEFMSTEEVGLYSIAARFTEFWYFIPIAIVSTLTPYFFKLRDSNPLLYHAQLMRLYSAMFWGGVVIGICVLFWGETVLVLLLGESFRPASGALILVIWSSIFVAQGLARGIWLIAEDLQKYRLLNNVFAVIINIGGNLILIPYLGIRGAAISTVATQGLTLWIVSFIWKPMRVSNIALLRSINPRYLFKVVPE